MKIGVPREIKTNESRVAMMPVGVQTLTRQGHTVLVQRSAGEGSGFTDDQYELAGAVLCDGPKEVFAEADMIVKVKEPLAPEIAMFKPGQTVFTYFHFAASEELTLGCLNSRIIAIAYETVTDRKGSLPLLTPMSEIAGKMSVQEGAKYLERPFGGRGVLLGGVPGVAPANVVILGGGVVGTCAAKIAAGFGANVSILDISLDRLRYLDDVLPANVDTVYSDPHNIRECCRRADLVIGAVLIPGAKAPHLVTRDLLKEMLPNSVAVDVSVDQGGCFETTKPTTHEKPTYVVENVLHYCVANMPGAVSRTSTIALNNATFPYVVKLANLGWEKAVAEDKGLAEGVNMVRGDLTNQPVAECFGLKYKPLGR
jgi:alanine dehydrogenase